MALDGAFLNLIKDEINTVSGAYVDKIYQPSKDELVFLLRTKEGAKRLLVCITPGRARVHFTQTKYENPATPPMFCMLMRKYLSSARFIKTEQDGFERILRITFSSTNEMGDIIYPTLVCEMIGASPNIILLDSNGKIIDALRHSNLEAGGRIIQPGATYTPPESQQKLNPFTCSAHQMAQEILKHTNLILGKAILNSVGGFSPLISDELAFRCCGDPSKPVNCLTDADRMNLTGVLNGLLKELELKKSYILTDKSHNPVEFSFTKIQVFGPSYINTEYCSLSEALDAFYAKRENAARIKKDSQDLLKLLSVLNNRTLKKMQLRIKELESCRNREHLRVYGELIKANLYRLKNGMSRFEAENYYNNMEKIVIPLNPALSPSANADKYFKDYKKSYTAEKTLSQLIEQDKKDTAYFDSVLDSLARAETLSELNEIREELISVGLVASKNKNSIKKKKESADFKEYTSKEGFKILVGKNNRQNDLLTLKLASKNDLWFHTKNIPGSHVIVFCDNQNVGEETILYAAGLAAYNSKAQSSSNVPVDYTQVKFVKKPAGAKPGMVIYTTNKTVFVTPTAN